MIKFLDSIAEKAAYLIAVVLVKAHIKPVYVTIFRFVTAAPLSWYFFSRGEYLSNIIGLFLYMVIAILDWADGEMAKLYKLPKETAPLGKLIDHTSDRALMMIVLGSIFYGGMNTPIQYSWEILSVVYYSVFFFLTVSLYEFDRMFGIEFGQYPELEKKMNKLKPTPHIVDKLVYNFLNVHNNSITRICFTHNYVLIFGILTNLLLPSLTFLAIMHMLRILGIFFITYQTFKVGPTNFPLVTVLRQYRERQEKHYTI